MPRWRRSSTERGPRIARFFSRREARAWLSRSRHSAAAAGPGRRTTGATRGSLGVGLMRGHVQELSAAPGRVGRRGCREGAHRCAIEPDPIPVGQWTSNGRASKSAESSR